MEVILEKTIHINEFKWTIGSFEGEPEAIYEYQVLEPGLPSSKIGFGPVINWQQCAVALCHFIDELAQRHDLEKLMEGDAK